MKCPACGQENRATAGYCAWCGTRLARPEGEVAEGQAAASTPQEGPDGPLATVGGMEPPAESVPLLPAAPTSPPQEPARAEAAPGAAPEAQEAVGATGIRPLPLHPGDVLAERYEVVEVIESTPERNRYRARDLRRCTTCGYDDNPLRGDFCRKCGASLDKPAYSSIVELLTLPPEHYDLRFSDQEREYFATAEPQPEEAPTSAARARAPLRLHWGRATDQGLQRDHNEDYLEAWVYTRGSGGLLGLFVVADGLGGQDSGEVASRLATETVWTTLREDVWEPIIRGESLEGDVISERLVAAVNAANKAVYETRQQRHSEMNTTLTLALIVDDMAYIGNVGDSRTYLMNASGLSRITRDHSLVQRLVDTGQITPQDVYTHPQRNLIYQSIGDRPELRPDTFRHQLAPDERLILCSDGLWEMVRDEGLEEVLLAEPDPQRACERLVRNANLAGGEDNISIIIVQALAA